MSPATAIIVAAIVVLMIVIIGLSAIGVIFMLCLMSGKDKSEFTTPPNKDIWGAAGELPPRSPNKNIWG